MTSMAAVLSISDTALAKILEIRAGEPEPDALVLRIEVTGEQAGTYTYQMEFRHRDELSDDTIVQHHDDLSVAMPPSSVEKLRGALLDWAGSGMAMRNPNQPRPTSPPMGPSRPAADLTGEVPQRVILVLDEQINPAIAGHGGHAELVAIEDTIAYLRLSGGCQGCGMAAVTLGQGIEVAILDAVPEITEVIDVTDHASGANPYYEAAKK